jgi:RimJ/RimL family protein N-acetyltransferase
VSNLPTDGVLFSCCDITALPPLDVNWHHEENKNIQVLDDIKANKPSEAPVALPILKTKHLLLIPPREQDTEASFEALMASTNEVGCWFSWATQNLKLKQHRAHIREAMDAASDIYAHSEFGFLVWNHEQDKFIGEVWYKIRDATVPYFTIAYWFDTRQTGNGYATEALAEIIKYGFNHLKAKRIEVEISEKNPKSLAVAKRLGFIVEGTLKNYFRNFITDEVTASVLLSMTDVSQLRDV